MNAADADRQQHGEIVVLTHDPRTGDLVSECGSDRPAEVARGGCPPS